MLLSLPHAFLTHMHAYSPAYGHLRSHLHICDFPARTFVHANTSTHLCVFLLTSVRTYTLTYNTSYLYYTLLVNI